MTFDADKYVREIDCTGFADELAGQLDALETVYPGAAGLIASIRTALVSYAGEVQPVPYTVDRRMKLKVDLPVTDRCNMACRACSHFAPLATDAPMRDREDIAASVELLKEACGDRVFTVFINGGEPLLHPDIEDIVHDVSAAFPERERYLVSNLVKYGIKRSMLRALLPETGTSLAYSCYGDINKTGIKYADEDAKKYNFPFVLFGTNPPDFTSYLKNVDPVYPAYGKRECYMRQCPTLIGNYLYLCSPVAFLEYPNAAFGLDLRLSEFDRIDLRVVEHPDEVMVLMDLPHPFCRHCNVVDNHPIGWENSDCARGEWFDDPEE